MTIRSLTLAVLLTLSAVTAGWAQVTTQVNTELPAAQSVADSAAAPVSPGVLAFNVMWNGSSWDRIRGNTTDGLLVNLGTNNDVTVTGSVTASNGGTFVVQENGAALTALQVIDNVVFVDDAAFTPGTSSVTAIGYTFDDVSPDTVNEGDIGIGRMSANRNQYVTIRDAAGNERGLNIDANGALAAVITSTSITPGTAASDLGKAEDAAHSSADVGVLSLFVRADTAASSGANGDYVTPISDSTGRLWVNPGVIGVEDAAETAAGNLAMVGTVRRDSAASSAGTTGDNATLNTDNTGLLWVRIGASDVSASGGTSLADDADFVDGTTAGTPIGGVAESASPTTVTEGDFGWVAMTLNRALKVTLYNSSGTELSTDTQGTHGTTLGTITSVTGAILMGNASTATPTDVGADGDAAAIWLTRNGAVNIADGGGSITVDGTVTVTDGSGALNVICDSGCSGSGASHTDDAAFTAATDDGVPIFGMFDDTTPDSVNENDAGVVRMSANRNLYTTLRDAAGNERGANVNSSNELLVALSSVPSHAVTNAGTFAVQESGGALTALQLIDNLVQAEDAVAGSGFAGMAILAVRQDSQTALAADGDFIPFTIDSAGGLRVSIVSGAGSGGTSLADDADFVDGTTSGTPVGGVAESASPTTVTEGDFGWFAMTLNRALKVTLYNSAGTELTQDTRGTHATSLGTITSVTGGILMGNASSATPTDVGADGDAAALWLTRNGALNIADAGGSITVDGTVTVTDGAGALNVILDSGTLTTVSTVTTLSQLGGVAVPIEDAAETAAGTGIYAMGVRRDTLASSAGTTGDNTMDSYTANGALWVAPVAATNGGTAVFRSLDLDETEEDVKTSAGTLYSMWVTNTATSTRWIKCYNATAANVTVGTTTPVFTVGIPGNSSDDVTGNLGIGSVGYSFSTALSCAATTGVADNDTGAPAANDVIINAFYL